MVKGINGEIKIFHTFSFFSYYMFVHDHINGAIRQPRSLDDISTTLNKIITWSLLDSMVINTIP